MPGRASRHEHNQHSFATLISSFSTSCIYPLSTSPQRNGAQMSHQRDICSLALYISKVVWLQLFARVMYRHPSVVRRKWNSLQFMPQSCRRTSVIRKEKKYILFFNGFWAQGLFNVIGSILGRRCPWSQFDCGSG